MKSIFCTSFLPPTSYFVYLKKSDEIILDYHENYQKQTLRNRCIIATSQNTLILSVPIKSISKHIPTYQTLIDNSSNWRTAMLRSIQTAYGKAPFFEYYYDDIEKIILYKHDKLCELNEELMTICLKWLKVKKNLSYSVDYQHVYADFFDFRKDNLYDKIEFAPYIQLFGNVFVPNLSIIDLLFCEGPNATNVIDNSIIN